MADGYFILLTSHTFPHLWTTADDEAYKKKKLRGHQHQHVPHHRSGDSHHNSRRLPVPKLQHPSGKRRQPPPHPYQHHPHHQIPQTKSYVIDYVTLQLQ